ncbi:MAG: xanthine dehydrogenase family protein subunit M [Deltaproteobacteria bacterium]|nr:MAG: xanthine dehydrogenase family protein subunit M [Deltaproteobacteria bacterium]
MMPLRLVRPPDLEAAGRVLAEHGRRAVVRAGGIDLLDRWKEGIDRPDVVVDLRALLAGPDGPGLASLTADEGHLAAGSLVTLEALAEAELPPAFAAVRQAASSAANPAIRRMATLGGNLLQRPRCWYFRHGDLVCLKKGGARCLAAEGRNRYNAVLGGGPSYIVHPSTLATALALYDGDVMHAGAEDPAGRIPLADLFVTPDRRLDAEHALRPAQILTAVRLSAPPGLRSGYDAVRERRLYDWPYVEAAAALRVEGGVLRDVRIVLGQVAPVPWRARAAERRLEGAKATEAAFAEASRLAFEGARPLSDNAGKIAVGRGLVRRLLHRLAEIPLPA